MKREDILVLAQLLHAMREAAEQLEDALRKEDDPKVNSLKKEILVLQRQINGIL